MLIPRRGVSISSSIVLNSKLLPQYSLEIYFKDSCSLLIVFPSKRDRQSVSEKLQLSVTNRAISESRSPLVLRTPLLGRVSSKVMSGFRDELATAQRKWQAREISNVINSSFRTITSLLTQAYCSLRTSVSSTNRLGGLQGMQHSILFSVSADLTASGARR